MATIKLTATFIEKLEPPKQRVEYYDTDCKGMILRVNTSGDKYYALRYRNKSSKYIRYTIGKHGILSLTQARKEAKRLLGLVAQGDDIQQDKNKDDGLTFIDYLNTFYLDWFKNNRKEYKAFQNTLLNCCIDLHKYKLHELDKPILHQFLYRYQKDRKVTNSRLNRIMASVKGAISRAVEFGYLTENKLSGFTAMKESTHKIRYFSEEEKTRLFEALKTTPELTRNIVTVAYYTGMRRGEIFTLKWKDINFSTKQIVLDKDNTKSGKSRYIPMHEEVMKVFNALEQTNKTDLIFKSPVTGKKLDTIKRSWATLMKTAEIDNFRFHDLRHNFCSMLAMKGIPLYTIAQIAGHSDVKMTQRYAHLCPDHLSDAISAI